MIENRVLRHPHENGFGRHLHDNLVARYPRPTVLLPRSFMVSHALCCITCDQAFFFGGKARTSAGREEGPPGRKLSVVKIWIRSWIYLQYLVFDFYRSCLFSFQRFCNWLSVALPGQSPRDRLNILNELRTQNISGNFSFADTNGNFTLLPSSFNVSVVLKSLDEFFQMVVTVFDCINHEYFEGFGDEESLVKRAINTSESPTIASKLTRWDQGTFLGKLPTYPSPKLTLTLLT